MQPQPVLDVSRVPRRRLTTRVSWPMLEQDLDVRRLEIALRRCSGSRAARVVDRENRVVEEHAHDWPVISVFVAGSYRNRSELGETLIRSPSVLLYRRGDRHENEAGALGHEQIEIEFDPDWLKGSAPLDRPRRWVGGRVALAGTRLANLWSDPIVPIEKLREATATFLLAADADIEPVYPSWLKFVEDALATEEPPCTEDLARMIGRSPAWLASAYRTAVGEGISQTVRRHRVERAVALLRSSKLSAVEVAAATGFCDQSHMIRSCNAVLGRSPGALRRDTDTLIDD